MVPRDQRSALAQYCRDMMTSGACRTVECVEYSEPRYQREKNWANASSLLTFCVQQRPAARHAAATPRVQRMLNLLSASRPSLQFTVFIFGLEEGSESSSVKFYDVLLDVCLL